MATNDKRQQIVITAMNLFYMQGIHAVGINEILKESGIAKKTLYHHFNSKEDLIVATLHLRHQNFMNWFSNLLKSASTPKQGIVNAFLGLDHWFNDKVPELGSFRGCFFINASAEYSQPGHPIFEVCSAHKYEITQLFLDQTVKFTPQEEQAVNLANVLAVLKDGCISAALIQNDKEAATKVINTVKSLLEIND